MTMMEHLVELRRRLMWCFVALLIAFGVCVFFASEIFDFLSKPLMDILRARNEDATLIYTKLYEVFFTEIKIGFYAAAFLAFPIFAIQLWKFVAPGLYSKEKSAFRPFLIATPILFFAGGAMVYYAIMPLAWEFFAAFQNTGESGARIELLPKVEEYLSLVIKLIFAFGIAFQLPVVLTLLAKVDLVTSKGLAKFRKYAVVLVFVFAAILTPPDVISQIGLAIPILFLYEVSIFLARMIEKKRAEEDAAMQAELAD
ncbi:MAG: twin-arginine translocase subunit TatC [Rhodospirillaceae bacterium]|nr:twin-arginine translocase subunit TatC [Rhodospirillaceae bacterium]